MVTKKKNGAIFLNFRSVNYTKLDLNHGKIQVLSSIFMAGQRGGGGIFMMTCSPLNFI